MDGSMVVSLQQASGWMVVSIQQVLGWMVVFLLQSGFLGVEITIYIFNVGLNFGVLNMLFTS